MRIYVRQLIELAAHQAESFSEAMHEPLYIAFEIGDSVAKDSQSYDCKDGSLIVMDVDESGKVLGIEIV